MVKYGLLLRIKNGHYQVVPYEIPREDFVPNWHLLGSYLAKERDYYIGYYSALQLHGYTTQPWLKEQVVVNRQITPAEVLVGDINFQFVYHNEKHFFGSEKVWVDNHRQVYCSDLEKTIIDSLFKPHYVGGIPELAKTIHALREKLAVDKLVDYAERFGSAAVVKRLGFLLELMEIKHDAVEKLRKIRTLSYTPLDTSMPTKGKYNRRWRVLQNIDNNAILSPIYT